MKDPWKISSIELATLHQRIPAVTMRDISDETKADNDHDCLRNVALTYRLTEPVQRLPSFNKKNHRVPDTVNSHTQAFVAKLANDRVRQDLDDVFAQLRSAFRFKRSEIESTDLDAASGAITTPLFRYTSSAAQNPNVASEYIWQRDISHITDTDRLGADEFVEAFGKVFDTVEVTPRDPINLEQIIDRLEEIDDDRIWLEYDRQITQCEITIDGCEEEIHVTSESLRIVHPQAQSPQTLVDSLFRIQSRLLIGNR